MNMYIELVNYLTQHWYIWALYCVVVLPITCSMSKRYKWAFAVALVPALMWWVLVQLPLIAFILGFCTLCLIPVFLVNLYNRKRN